MIEFCLCSHAKECHKDPSEVSKNDDVLDSCCSFDNGHYVCPCEGFRHENTNTAKVRLRATNGIDEEEVTKL